MRIFVAAFVLLLGCLGNPRSFGAGLVVVDDASFWDRQMPIIPPRVPGQPPPEPRIWPPRRPPPPPPTTGSQPLELSSARIKATVRDQLARTEIVQEIYNPNGRAVEGTFLFPVPAGSQLTQFTMEIGGKTVPAELLTADKARQIYEDIVRRARDPALLEYAGRDRFRVRIARK